MIIIVVLLAIIAFAVAPELMQGLLALCVLLAMGAAGLVSFFIFVG